MRALTPHVGAYLELPSGDRLGVRAAQARPDSEPGLAAGQIVADERGRMLVGCTPGVLVVTELQPPGKRAMATVDWLRGHPAPERVELS